MKPRRTTPSSAGRRRFRALAAVLVLTAPLALTSCAGRLETRGNLPDPELVADLKPGEIYKDEIKQMLGSPSTTALFDEEAWFYISERTRTVAFFEPKVLERTVLVLTFNKDGLLTSKRKLTAADGKHVTPVDRKTPTSGKELTLIEQLLGNFGRFK